jgi:DNA-binding protein Fis
MNNLPVLAHPQHGGSYVSETTFANERDILYKFIFDLKKDMNEMKRMFVELVNTPGGGGAKAVFSDDDLHPVMTGRNDHQMMTGMGNLVPAQQTASAKPVIMQPAHGHVSTDDSFDLHEEVDESLNIMEMEKDLIIKALKKHRNKRKDAALDLGISERTLYRKLKEYDIEDLYQTPKPGLKTYR